MQADEEPARISRELQEANEHLRYLHSESLAELGAINHVIVARYGEEHQLVLTLQRTFLPESLPRSPETDLAVRYPAAAGHGESPGSPVQCRET